MFLTHILNTFFFPSADTTAQLTRKIPTNLPPTEGLSVLFYFCGIRSGFHWCRDQCRAITSHSGRKGCQNLVDLTTVSYIRC